MNANPFLGVIFHAVGGLAAGSFYIPYKKVRGWAWESYWIVGGFFSWIIAPWVMAWLTVPNPVAILRASPVSSLVYCYLFGILWGIGGLTFGLSMRYLGMSLGYALALGFCATFGTIVPPIALGTFAALFAKTSGLVTMGGVGVCLAGIAVCGRAGVFKERELSGAAKQAVIGEFNFAKGVWVAIFAGIMSAFMGIAMATVGKPIAAAALANGADPLFSNTPMHIVIMAGGFTTNFIWCVLLNCKNRTGGDYLNAKAPLLINYLFSALAGVIWYLQFFFYGMGQSQMGERYEFSSWTLHMAFIIVFSNLWGLYFKEWTGTGARTRRLIFAGILVLIFSTIVVGWGNYLDALK